MRLFGNLCRSLRLCDSPSRVFSDGLNENWGNVVNVNFALMCKLLEFGVVGVIHLAVRSVVPVTLGILCGMRCSGGINHLHSKRDCCLRVSCTCVTKKIAKQIGYFDTTQYFLYSIE